MPQHAVQPLAAAGEPAHAAMEQRQSSGAGPFGAPLQALPQDCEADLSEVFNGGDRGWKKSGWRS